MESNARIYVAGHRGLAGSALLRRLTSGDRLPSITTCPSPDCREKLDLELSVESLLIPPYADVHEQYEHRVSTADGHSILVRFRLATGSDQEVSAALARSDTSAAVDFLVRRCVQSAVSSDDRSMQEFPAGFVDQLSAAMAERDVQAEITLQINCTGCGGTFNLIFDTAAYLMQELAAEIRGLDHEVHLLAYHYHWSSTEILGLTMRKRRRFLQLLEDELQREMIQ